MSQKDAQEAEQPRAVVPLELDYAPQDSAPRGRGYATLSLVLGLLSYPSCIVITLIIRLFDAAESHRLSDLSGFATFAAGSVAAVVTGLIARRRLGRSPEDWIAWLVALIGMLLGWTGCVFSFFIIMSGDL